MTNKMKLENDLYASNYQVKDLVGVMQRLVDSLDDFRTGIDLDNETNTKLFFAFTSQLSTLLDFAMQKSNDIENSLDKLFTGTVNE